jgi:hypothetical protein
MVRPLGTRMIDHRGQEGQIMDKQEIQDFFRWLETTSPSERAERREEILGDLDVFSDRDFRSDAYFQIRHIELAELVDLQVSGLALREKLFAAQKLKTKFIERQAQAELRTYIRALERRLLQSKG